MALSPSGCHQQTVRRQVRAVSICTWFSSLVRKIEKVTQGDMKKMGASREQIDLTIHPIVKVPGSRQRWAGQVENERGRTDLERMKMKVVEEQV